MVSEETIRSEFDPSTVIASSEGKAEDSSLESNTCDIKEHQEKKEDIGTTTKMKPNHEPNYGERGCDEDKQILCCKTVDRETTEKPKEKKPPQAPSTSETPCKEDIC